MWELDYKESWALKNWCFWTVVLEKTLESPWTARRSNQSMLKEISPEFHWKDWGWSWSSNTLATRCEELTHWKRPWCWQRLKAGEGDDRGWDSWMVSLTQRTWVWACSRSWWWTGKPGMLQSMRSQTVRRDWATELNGTEDWKAKGGKSWAENGSPEVDKVNRVEHSLISVGINQNWSSRSAEVKECWMKCKYTNPQKDWRSVVNQLILPVICFYANCLLLGSKSKSFLDFWWHIRILLPKQGTWAQSLVQEDSTWHRATKPVC